MSRIVKIEGLSELQAKFEEMNIEFHPKVRSIVAKHGAALQQRTKSNMSAAYRAIGKADVGLNQLAQPVVVRPYRYKMVV